jgi:phosphoenolpyruvate---glycerone phosphotransferase subunit DhaL
MDGSLRAAILAAVEAVEAAREMLCELDARTGDGDHGVTMTIGARGVRRQLDAIDTDDPIRLLRASALGMAGAGGAIGPIYGRALLAVAAELEAIGVGSDGSVTRIRELAVLARCAAAAQAAIAGLGRASPGDKTILDALGPTTDALAEADREGRPLDAALEAARTAARAGAAATVDMVATVGRSSRFGERSRGSADPGATSFAIVVDALVSSALGAGRRATPDPAD